MSFFDVLGKKVSEAGQKTMQKTKEISDISRLNSLISEEEKEINAQYYKIGKLYVSLCGDHCQDEFRGAIQAIADSEERIREYRKEIREVRGVNQCEKCGAEVPKSASFCSACGSAMRMENAFEREDRIKCPTCGESVKKDMRFCTFCGNPIGAVLDPGKEVGAEKGKDKKSNSEIRNEMETVCPVCGAKMESESLFCTECGAKM